MNDESTFRGLLLVGLAIGLCIGAFFRIRSQWKGEKLDRRQEGLLLLIATRLFGLLFFITFILFLSRSDWFAWAAMPLPSWLRWLGVVVGTLTLLLLFWTMYNLGKNLTDTVVTRKDAYLVTTGPYRWVRHPFYMTFALGLVAIALVSANWLPAAMGGIGLLCLIRRTDLEEAKLIEKFGDNYRDYMKRTGRFLPWW